MEGGIGRERSQVVSAFRCVRRGRREERAEVIEVRRSARSCVEGEESSKPTSRFILVGIEGSSASDTGRLSILERGWGDRNW